MWRVPPAATLHWRDWDDESVVFHEQSGDTHRLNRVGASVLRLLATMPMTAADLVRRLSDGSAGDHVPTQPLIDDLLTRLSDVGLVESLNDDPARAAAPGTR